MLGYRKHSFVQAHTLFRALRNDLDDLTALKKLQELLLREIVRAEEKIRQLKAELRARPGTTERIEFGDLRSDTETYMSADGRPSPNS
jgi:hypothetical protein